MNSLNRKAKPCYPLFTSRQKSRSIPLQHMIIMMIPRKLYYMLHSGKNSKLRYYITSYLWILTPHCLLSLFRKMVLSKVSQRDDWEEISQRVEYYNKLQRSTIDH